MPYTVDSLKEWRLRYSAHLDGPRGKAGWFGDMHICIQEPRLQRRTQHWRKDRSTTVTWFVDGAEVASLEAAVDALNTAPVLNFVERKALELVPDEFTDIRKVAYIPTLILLRDKGVIEFADGKCRRRKLPE